METARFALVSLMVALLAMGCAQTANQNLKIGLVTPLTGETAAWGQNAIAGATLAVNEINAQGGVNGRKVVLLAEDDKCTSESVKAFSKLIDVDRVEGILGPVCSAAAAPALPIAQERHVPVVIVAASAPGLTRVGDQIYRVYPSDSAQGDVAATFMYDTFSVKKVAIVYVNNDWGAGLESVFSGRFEALGGEVVYSGATEQGAADFRTELLKVSESGAEAVYMPLQPASGVAALKQMGELGLGIPVVGGDFFDTGEVIENPASEGVMYVVPKIAVPEEFKERVRSVEGFEDLQVSIAAPLGYDATKVLLSAIGEAEKGGMDVKDALAKGTYEGISNPLIRFDAQGDLAQPTMEIRIVRDGESIPYK